ncbi:PREDICTED: phospholipase D gamma 1 [Tarenaya hassleriana]|uniref:phospholipase D gamma 1 n=1 Tax=Tarenaya hassleriana TaxID=28532 RepID=UPI00053C2449|nr:PREDICTED: phospholipase D gamma 1 [Tarenaya hassleriana]
MAYHPVYTETMSFGGSSHGQGQQSVPFSTNNGSMRVLLLHGNLDIWVKEARNLPNMDMFHNKLGEMFSGFSKKSANKAEGQKPSKITSDPYVTVSVCGAVIARTFVINNSESPVWMQHFDVPVAHNAAEVHFVVKDNDIFGSQIIGAVGIPAEQLWSGNKVEGFFPILNSSGKPCKPGAVLNLSIQFTPMERMSLYKMGVGSGPDYAGVPGTYFPLRKGGRVTLYQDAHVDDDCMLPNLNLDGGIQYRHGRCWEDVASAISQARRLVYITGWSVYHPVRLVRRNNDPTDGILGELLKSKSQEGVRVLLLVWDDPTSRSILGIKTQGVMGTSDEETRRFFKHSSVQVLLCPRSGGKGHSFIKKSEVGTIYTHHQKTVIVDADAGQNRRKIIAFVGGLDLCNGRYDTPKHPLFRTLRTLHKDDFHNPNFVTTADDGPREPWHDLHSRIDGPAAYDVLANFEERWLKASKPRGLGKLKTSRDDSLLRIERIPDIMGISEISSANDNDPESWHVQVFRSIDSSSVKGFPKDPREATGRNLLCGKNILIDMSIHAAYVKAIRSAQHFIYIENQYFLGSSFNWDSNKDLGANNLIPMEIALKIANKIRARERFSVYIVIPMWPEGAPTSNPIQRILFWQHKTMQMMYETIYKALVEVGLDGQYEPQDFLNFFCLGTREVPEGTVAVYNPRNQNQANPVQVQALKSRRFMIYVHSKGMIVDDEYVIIGSANINQRSLEGTRDTEIAMGGYQPHHTWAMKGSRPRGQIYGYRMSLWAEHLGFLEQGFEQAESLECVRRVRQMSEFNWRQFAAEEVTEMKGHLLKYPVQVDRTGKVRPLPGCETFPDVGGKILGSFLAVQENLTI